MTRILFLHGYGARPGGFKPTFLRGRGYEVINPGLPDDDFDASIRIAAQALVESQPDIVVGSSRGGAVAVNLDLGQTPCVLIAPAWKRWGTASTVGPRTIVVHSMGDETIPLEDSRELVKRSGLGDESLVVVGENHFMVDEAALSALVAAIDRLTAG